VMRASAYEVLSGDAVRGLRAKGLSPRTVLLKHTLRAAAGPVLTILALDLGSSSAEQSQSSRSSTGPGWAWRRTRRCSRRTSRC
jgi:peptide/nickel transport system permease protein